MKYNARYDVNGAEVLFVPNAGLFGRISICCVDNKQDSLVGSIEAVNFFPVNAEIAAKVRCEDVCFQLHL